VLFFPGLLLKFPVLDQITETDGLFEDAMFWTLPESPEEQCNNENKYAKHIIRTHSRTNE